MLKSLLKYQEEYCETDKMEQTKDSLRALGYDDLDNLENSEDEQSSTGGGEEDTTHIGDDICLDDLTGTVNCTKFHTHHKLQIEM